VNIVNKRELDKAPTPSAKNSARKKIAEFREPLCQSFRCRRRGYIDAIIEPADTRARIIHLSPHPRKQARYQPRKKHGNIPL